MNVRKRDVVFAWAIFATPVMAQLRAFPEAEGFGAGAVGGRGGTVYHVTNLNDTGAGSFRDAVSQPNRIVVFDVGGYITLNSSVTVKNNITIAGQTAPGQGIATRGASISFKNSNNTIVRNMRFRNGVASGGDAVWADTTTNDLILDHVTAQWGQDETLSVTGCDRITIQNCIIAEGLLAHSMGSLIEWNTISMHHNLYMSNNSRNPKTKGVNDFVNNVIYNWGTEPYIAGDSAGVSEANVVNNYFVRGPSSGADPDPFSRGNENYHLYLSGNYYDNNKNGILDGTLVTQAGIDDPMTYMATPFAYPAIRTDTAAEAYAKVVAGVGSSFVRDTVDQRLITELTTGGGKIITDPTLETPGFGTITSGVAPLDTDQDGMPDAWETPRGLNPNNAADRNNIAPSGYTRVEEYLNDMWTTRNVGKTWSAASGAWSTSASWAGGSPTTDQDAFVISPTSATNGSVTVSSGNASAFRLFIGKGGAAAGERVNVSGTGTLDVPYLVTVGYQNSGVLNVSGGTVNTWAIALGNTLNGTFGGTLNFSGGTIRAGRIASGGTSSFAWSGGTLKPNGSELTVATNVNITATGGAFEDEGGTIYLTGQVSGTAGITKTGTGTMILSASNTYTGPTVVHGGMIAVGSINNIGVASGVGAPATNSTSNLVLDGAVLRVDSASTTNRGISISENGGGFSTLSTGSLTLNGPIAMTGAGDRTVTFDTAGTTTSWVSVALGDPTSGKASLVKNGTARLGLQTVTKSYSGDTVVNGGNLLCYLANVLPYGPGKGDLIVASGASVDLRFDTRINGLNGAGTISNGSGATRAFTLGYGDATGSFSGSITSTNNLIKTGLGMQILSGSNSYTGTTAVNAGILQFNSITSVGGTGASVSIASGAIVAAGYAIDQPLLARINPNSTGVLALAVNSSNPLDFSATGANLASVSLSATVISSYTGLLTPSGTNYRLGGGTAQLTLPNANALTGTRNVNVIPGGVIAVTNSNDYTGTTSISGTMAISVLANGGTPSSLGMATSSASNLTIDGGTLRFVGSVGASSDRNFTLTQNGGLIENNGTAGITFAATSPIVSSGSGNRTLTLGGSHYNTNGNDAFVTPVGDPTVGFTSITKTGTGRWFFNSTSNTYSGDTTVLNGDLYTGATNVVPYGTGKGNLVVNGGRFYLYTGNQSINALNGTGGSIDAAGSRTLTLGNGNASGAYAGRIVSPITVTKVGTGTQTFSGSSTYTGATNVTAGVLRVDGSISGSSNVVVSSSATFQAGSTQTIKALTLNAGSKAQIVPGARRVLQTSTLTLSGTAKLDLADGALVIPATGTLAGSTITVAALRAAIIAGRGGVGTGAATWNGAGGIGTSSFNFDETASSLGYVWNADPNLLTGAIGSVNDRSVSPTDYVVKFTAGADANLDGVVDDIDVAVIGLTYDRGATTGHHWYEADFNYDGKVDDDDVAILGLSYNPSGTPLSPQYFAALSERYGDEFASAFAAASIVPEPATLGAITLLGWACLSRRRPRK